MASPNPYKKELIITSDGSHTLYMPELGEQYHSTHGARQESMHVFIQAGLQSMLDLHPQPNILEVGMGTGLNVWLTLQQEFLPPLTYHAIEPFPLEPEWIGQLNFARSTGDPALIQAFEEIHQCAGTESANILNRLWLTKWHEPLQHLQLNSNYYHLVYFDAFAPEIQPEMWTELVFRQLYDAMARPGILVTYCAKGIVRRAMKAAGFQVSKLPGPPGKREITRAQKN